jgi:hypothetical protein
MLFILIAWSLVLLTFTIWLRALHSIPIYTHTTQQLHEQTLQVQNVASMTQILFALAVVCIALHFMLPSDAIHLQAPINASALEHTNFTSRSVGALRFD